jgi:hypothetical protein
VEGQDVRRGIEECGPRFRDEDGLPSSYIKESLDGRHVAKVTPPSPTMAFQMVARDPPPLALLAPGFPPDRQLSAPLAPDVAEKVDRVGVIPGPNGHEVSVPPSRVPSLATDRADRHEGGSKIRRKPSGRSGMIGSSF